MKMDNNLVDKLAHLSRLSFKDEEKERILSDMNKILSFVEKVDDLNTDGIEELSYVNDDLNVLREDEAQQIISKEDALKNAPLSDSDYFKVPKVLDK